MYGTIREAKFGTNQNLAPQGITESERPIAVYVEMIHNHIV